jgi:hypothetical protein
MHWKAYSELAPKADKQFHPQQAAKLVVEEAPEAIACSFVVALLTCRQFFMS